MGDGTEESEPVLHPLDLLTLWSSRTMRTANRPLGTAVVTWDEVSADGRDESQIPGM